MYVRGTALRVPLRRLAFSVSLLRPSFPGRVLRPYSSSSRRVSFLLAGPPGLIGCRLTGQMVRVGRVIVGGPVRLGGNMAKYVDGWGGEWALEDT